MTLLAGLSDPEYVALTTALEGARAFASQAIPPPNDEDLRQAAVSLAATAETALRGVIYEHQPDSLVAARLAGAIREALDGSGGSGRGHDAATASAMRRVERGIRLAREADSGDPAAFWAFLGRVLRPRVADAGMERASAERPDGPDRRIIVP